MNTNRAQDVEKMYKDLTVAAYSVTALSYKIGADIASVAERLRLLHVSLITEDTTPAKDNDCARELEQAWRDITDHEVDRARDIWDEAIKEPTLSYVNMLKMVLQSFIESRRCG